jgi:arabinan endo-1,5-alpha-L-arabinosidase
MALCLWNSGSIGAATLVGHYDFEDPDNLAHDSSGSANDGVISGSITQAPGYLPSSHGAFFDDGSSSTITIPPMTGYTGIPGFTFTAWVNQDAGATAYDGIISQDTGGCCDNRLLLSPAHHPFINVGQHSDRPLNGTTLAPGTWYQLVLTGENSDASGGAVAHVYLNGVEIAGSPQFFDPLPDGTGFSTYLGAGEGGSVHFFRGTLDDVRIYEGALTPREVTDLYNSSLPEPASASALALAGAACALRRRR